MVTFAYQDMVIPFRRVQAQGEIEKATGYKINWRQFGGGCGKTTLLSCIAVFLPPTDG